MLADGDFRPLCGNLLGCTLDGPCEPAPFVLEAPPKQRPRPDDELTLGEIRGRVDRLALGDSEYTTGEVSELLTRYHNAIRREMRRITAIERQQDESR